MAHWQLQYRNKVTDSNVENPVKLLVGSRDTAIAEAAKQVSSCKLCSDRSELTVQLVDYWSTLELEQRITRVKLTSVSYII
jgi:hypothetical protein